jgi:hypothetical protein
MITTSASSSNETRLTTPPAITVPLYGTCCSVCGQRAYALAVTGGEGIVAHEAAIARCRIPLPADISRHAPLPAIPEHTVPAEPEKAA